MRQLGVNDAASGMHRVGHRAPSFNLREREHTRDVDEPDGLPADPGRLSHDQSGQGTLAVILDVQLRWYEFRIPGPPPCHGSHDDPVPEWAATKVEGSKKRILRNPMHSGSLF